MTQITGKIYQQTNAAGTENRFPRTVMEAVLGLNSHLQQQFGALADIYMPIEGISEALTDQEFVFRKSPNTIKAKSLTLDRIKGRTLAWNQILMSTSYSNTWTDTRTYFALRILGSTDPVNQVSAEFYVNEDISSPTRKAYIFTASRHYYIIKHSGQVADIYLVKNTPTVSGHKYIALVNIKSIDFSTVGGTKLDANLTDLTLLYGSEIDGMTDAQILAKFESEYPGYHDYSAGKLISNDAAAVETVGFNQWDEQWESGGINSSTGTISEDSTRIRSKNYIPVIANTVYAHNSLYELVVLFYNENKDLVQYVRTDSSYAAEYNKGADSYADHPYFQTPNGCAYIKFVVINCPSYNHDICINISDSSRNGTYEPYRKSVLQLGLNNLKVKDSQGNITTFTGGLKSAGSVHDEIVGNKFIKRIGEVDLGSLVWSYVGGRFYSAATILDIKTHASSVLPNAICVKYVASTYNGLSEKTFAAGDNGGNPYRIYIIDSAYSDAAAFKTAMSGVMLNYELATPIEYDLVDPLNLSMPAGTTEARISPNADGLSAPFCGDITYGMGDADYANTAGFASYAGNAQYAEVAARLLTPRTIWGQAFDGSANITGAMTGVPAIDSLMYFDTSNGRIGIGISTPLYNLDVAGTFHATGNSRIGGDLDVTGDISAVSIFAAALNSIYTYYWSEDHDDIDCWWVESSGVAEFHEVGARAGFYLLDPEYGEHGEDVHHTISLGGGGFLFSDMIRTPSIGIGVNAPASGIAIGNTSALLTYDSTYNAIKVQPNLYSPGYISSGGVSTTSDVRMKTDVKPLSLSIEQIASAPAVEFNWVGNGQRGAGSIAQYWEEQLPYNVHHNGDLLTMEYGNIALISAIVCARKIQELEEQIKKLEAKTNV